MPPLISHISGLRTTLLFLFCIIAATAKIRAGEEIINGNRNDPVIINFGDSNSDTGGFQAGLGLDTKYPYGRIFPGQPPTGRACDGRLIIDFLCESVSTHYLSPYLDSFQPNFTNGVNFAIRGASSLPKYEHFNLGVQIHQFKRFRNHSIELHSKDFKDFLGKDAFENALYTVDIGQNDISYSFTTVLSYDRVIEKIPSFIDAIRDAVLTIYNLGGRNFWVHNTGPLGCLPTKLVTINSTNANDFDEHGCLKPLNEAAKVFNFKLRALSQELRSQMENSTIVYVDVYSIKYDLIANATSYGFKNPLMACYGSGGPAYNIDPEVNCRLDIDTVCTVCREDTPHINWDGIHYTEAANSIVASRILSTHYSTPPLQFNFAWNNDRVAAI